jgi:hypothetical protein
MNLKTSPSLPKPNGNMQLMEQMDENIHGEMKRQHVNMQFMVGILKVEIVTMVKILNIL